MPSCPSFMGLFSSALHKLPSVVVDKLSNGHTPLGSAHLAHSTSLIWLRVAAQGLHGSMMLLCK